MENINKEINRTLCAVLIISLLLAFVTDSIAAPYRYAKTKGPLYPKLTCFKVYSCSQSLGYCYARQYCYYG